MLYLLPNLLADLPSHTDQLPAGVDEVVSGLTHLIAENAKQGRRFLQRFSFSAPKTFRDIPILELNEHTTQEGKQELIKEVKKGGVWGLVSDCGMPCLADPGADLVLMARAQGIKVEALAGPSSPLLALVLSGLGGQRFAFHGYLPREEGPLAAEIKRIELLSQKEQSTHVFIETPYRNERLIEKLLAHLGDATWLCMAVDLTAPTQWVETRRISSWKKGTRPVLDKRPCVFVVRSLL